MATGDRGIALRQLNALFSIGVIGGVTDAQLLEWFTSHRDETADLAFRALVERHGPMVLRVCRAMLRDAADADDAFQATFLVLVRRAGSLWVRDSLGRNGGEPIRGQMGSDYPVLRTDYALWHSRPIVPDSIRQAACICRTKSWFGQPLPAAMKF